LYINLWIKMKLEKKIYKLRKEIRQDFNKLVKSLYEVFLEMDAYLESIGEAVKGGKDRNGIQRKIAKKD